MWQKIETAPRDGTDIFIYRDGWDHAPIARWGEYPGNPVEDGNDELVYMYGWVTKNDCFCMGHEDGFLGWDDDPMPTHWIPAPPDNGET